jgi:hypothetical protein
LPTDFEEGKGQGRYSKQEAERGEGERERERERLEMCFMNLTMRQIFQSLYLHKKLHATEHTHTHTHVRKQKKILASEVSDKDFAGQKLTGARAKFGHRYSSSFTDSPTCDAANKF